MKKFVVAAAILTLPAVGLAQSAEPAKAEDKVKCRRVAETGSNARAQKVCRKTSEWRRLQEMQRKDASDLTTPSGGQRTSG
jgi:uncharacterized membrane protein